MAGVKINASIVRMCPARRWEFAIEFQQVKIHALNSSKIDRGSRSRAEYGVQERNRPSWSPSGPIIQVL